MAAPDAVRTRGLVKRFGNLVAVQGVDLQVRPGTCLGLLGPNGAGKTTTIEILEGLTRPDEGQAEIFGQSWSEGGRGLRQRIGVQLQDTNLPPKLTVLEVLRIFASFYHEPRPVFEVLELVGLEEKRHDRVGNLSGGQVQRLALGCAVVGDPDLLFLDEPTTGLDPQARRRVWEIVEQFKASGRTVLLTTHYMDEAERLADDLVILDHGRIISEGTPASIIRSLGAENVISVAVEGEFDLDGLRLIDGVLGARIDAGRAELRVGRTEEVLPQVVAVVRSAGARLEDLNVHRSTLEDVFVSLTGRHLRDG
jgi:ABC-2 type transport system ATP-binding protein